MKAQPWHPDHGGWQWHKMISVTGCEKGLYVKKMPFLMVARPEDYGLHRRLFFLGSNGVWKPMLGQDLLFGTPNTFQTYLSKTDWNNQRNTVECVGGAACGSKGNTTSTGGGGGGGGSYNRINNYAFTTPGTTNAGYQPGAGGIWTSTILVTNGGDSWWGSTTQTAFPASGTGVGARGGKVAGGSTIVGDSATGGVGGLASASFPTTPYAVNGGSGGTAVSNSAGGGGGGSAGPHGAGQIGSTLRGGGADGSTLGGGATGAPGAVGTQPFDDWTSTNAVAGGGGAGTSAAVGAAGTAYGGGAGGAGRTTGTAGTPGGQGVVVAQWFPVVQFFGVTDNPDMFKILTIAVPYQQ